MRVTVDARRHLTPAMREHAEERLRRLERHASRLHEVRLIVEGAEGENPPFRAEVIVHMQHVTQSVSASGDTVREAIDRVAEKVDRVVTREKERVTDHRVGD